MNIYIIIAAIVLFIVFLFILSRIILKKGLKLSLFSGSGGSTVISSERNINIAKVLNNENKPKKSKNKLPSNKNDNEIVLINNALKKTEPNENAANSDKKESINKSVEGNKASPRLKMNSFEDVYEFLGNSGISDIVHYFENNHMVLIDFKNDLKKISSPAELEDYVKSKIISFLNNQYGDLKDKISGLRKNGKDMNNAEFRLLSVPLKIRLLSANFSKKDFDLVIKKIESIKEILKNY